MSAAPVLVLGSNSFSGAAFVDYLLSQGLAVIGLSRSAEPHDAFLPYKKNSHLSRFTFHQADLNQDIDRILKICNEANIGYFFNFAAQSMVAESWQYPEH